MPKNDKSIFELFGEFCEVWDTEFNCHENCEVNCPAYCFALGLCKYLYRGEEMKKTVQVYLTKSIPKKKSKRIIQEKLGMDVDEVKKKLRGKN